MLSYAKNVPNSCGPRVEMISDSPGESEFIALRRLLFFAQHQAYLLQHATVSR
jgi:hypothetical protein